MGSVTSGLERVIGRYALYGELASGGMATVHCGRLLGPVGFARTVAIKRLHPHHAKDPAFVTMFLDEARLVARIRHPNVVPTLDVVAAEGELLLVMEHVHGEALSVLLRHTRRARTPIPHRVASAILTNVLYGLHAAHEATNERGHNMGLVHRDVSPSNVIVGTDGVARVLDFGIAKAAGRLQTTNDGTIKGKLGYMSPEQVMNETVDRRSDVFAVGIVAWEMFTGKRLFERDNPGAMIHAVMYKDITPPSAFAPEVSQAVDSIVLGALVRDRGMRYQTAREMAVAIEEALAPATSREVSEWLSTVASDALFKRAHMVAAIERDSISDVDQDVLIPDSVRFSTDSARSLPDSVRTGATPATGTAVISGVGMQPEDDSPAPSKAKRIAAWAAAAVVVGGVVSALAFLDRTPSSTASSAVEATASAPPAAPIASATATASASPSATVSATASAAASVQRPKVQNPTTSPKPKADCTNPFRIDADGKKRPRPECFK